MMDKTVKLCKKLMAIESASGNELAIGDFVYKYLKQKGAVVKKQRVAKNRYNIIARIKGKAPKIQVVTHLDTVPGKVPIRIVGGRIYGRGACDVKGPMAALLTSLDGCKRDLTLIFDVGEEVDFIGAAKAVKLKEARKADLCLVTEPTLLRVTTSMKGVVDARITTIGKTMHSSLPQYGVNAINKMLLILKKLEKNKLVNFTVLKSGIAPNVIPDKCELVASLRIPIGKDAVTIGRQIKKTVGKLGSVGFGVLKQPWQTKITPEIKMLGKIADSKFETFPGYATCEFYSKYMPTVLFGPGEMVKAHTEDESIQITQLIKARKLYEKLWRLEKWN